MSLSPRTAAIVLCTALAAFHTTARADDAKEQQLEARIAELERMVAELRAAMQNQGTAASPPAASVAAAPKPATPPVQPSSIVPNAIADTRFSFTGYVKLDTMWSKYEDGEIPDGSVGRDFYLPSTIPVGGESESADYDSHVKQTRLMFGTDTELPNAEKLISRVEVDLYGSALGDERATNTYGVLLRHAYVQYKNWLVGQTWSNFQDATLLPETADYIGPTDGTPFVRQPLIRYTTGPWSFSLENPETTITPLGGGTRISSDDNSFPDVTAAYSFKVPNGTLRLAALGRQLKLETTGAGAMDDSTFAAALSLGGKLTFGKEDIRFTLTGGDGIGRYVGVNFNNDAVIDSAGGLDAISGWAGFIAWRHPWNEKLRTNLMYSASSYDNDVALTGLAANKSSSSWAVNAFYTPVSKLDVGIELRHAEREIESGADGSMKRIQGILKYAF